MIVFREFEEIKAIQAEMKKTNMLVKYCPV